MRKAVWPVFGWLLSACTTMPDSYTRGAADIWPRWGYRVTNETPESLDLEIIMLDTPFACTDPYGQMEKAKEIFIECAAMLSERMGKTLEVPAPVDLSANHIYGCTMRVGKRLRVLGQPPAAPKAEGVKTPTAPSSSERSPR